MSEMPEAFLETQGGEVVSICICERDVGDGTWQCDRLDVSSTSLVNWGKHLMKAQVSPLSIYTRTYVTKQVAEDLLNVLRKEKHEWTATAEL